jgi:hypothetical protein
LSSQLSSKIEALDKRLSELSENNDQQQGRIKQQIAAQVRSVSMCTFVPVMQVNGVLASAVPVTQVN